MTYTYIAKNNEGRKTFGSADAKSEAALQTLLQKKGLSGAVCFESKTKYRTVSDRTVSPKELSVLCRQMSILFFSQITFMEGVLLLSEQSENRQLKIALTEIYERMADGYPFADAMAMYEHIFGRYLINMVSIGETSGTLEKIFSIMSDYFDKEDKTRRKIKNAVTYPAILSVLMGAIILLLILRILPMFQETLYNLGVEAPGVTRLILSVSQWLNNNLIYLFIAVLAVLLAARLCLRTSAGKAWLDKAKVTYPVSGYIYARIITTRFSRSVSLLLKSGVQLLNALDETKTLINNQYIEKQFDETARKVKQGSDLAEALKDMKVFPPLFLKVVTVGQATGRLDVMLDQSASVFESEVDESLERFQGMIEPLLIIILSGVVGVILLSVMLPMVSIMNQIA